MMMDLFNTLNAIVESDAESNFLYGDEDIARTADSNKESKRISRKKAAQLAKYTSRKEKQKENRFAIRTTSREKQHAHKQSRNEGKKAVIVQYNEYIKDLIITEEEAA